MPSYFVQKRILGGSFVHQTMKIGIRLQIAFFLVAFISISVVGMLAYWEARDSLRAESFDKLTAVREMKAGQIEDYFHQLEDQILTHSEDPTIIQAMIDFKAGFNALESELDIDKELDTREDKLKAYFRDEYLARLNENLSETASIKEEISSDRRVRLLQSLYIAENPNAVGDKHLADGADLECSYDTAHRKYHPFLRNYLQRFGFYDIFLVDNFTGQIVYSVFKEVDYATSLTDGPFKNTNLASVFKETRDADNPNFTSIVDFEAYHPSYNKPASFIATPIFDGCDEIGVLIFQMPIDKINGIMTSHEKWSTVGLGATGETYIVGKDFTLRNQSRFLIEDSLAYFQLLEDIDVPQETIDKIKNFNSTIGLQEVRTEGTKAALGGREDEQIFSDYRNVPVLSSYRPLNIQGLDWVIMSEMDESEAFAPVYALRKNIILFLSIMMALIIISSFFISRAITSPVKNLTVHAMQLAKGNLDVEIDVYRKDEIGILSVSFRKMQASVKHLISELKDLNAGLENKVIERTKELQEQKELVEVQKEMVEEKNKEIVDSINYAKRLQSAIIPNSQALHEKLGECFVMFRPKDIVSGDFYWMTYDDKQVSIAAADCTGHGVPGAMVSVVGANSLNRCVKEFGLTKPSEVLDQLRDLIMETFSAGGSGEIKDGMDISYYSYDKKTGTVQWAGANNPLWIIRNGSAEVEEIKANKQPIGKFIHHKPFTNHEVKVNKGDCLYVFTDGFADQFGGARGKKFKDKPFKDFLLSVSKEVMEVQGIRIEQKFLDWKGDFEQVDDICLIGMRI